MVDHQVDQHPYATLLSGVCKFDKITDRSVSRIDTVIVGDIVAVVAVGRHLKRHQPDGRYPQPVQVIKAARQAVKSPIPSPSESI
jgi:hypothetical protein